VDPDLGRSRIDPDDLVIVEVPLLDPPVLERDLAHESIAQAHDASALDLRPDALRITSPLSLTAASTTIAT
jgi:hypothetical protein